MMCSEDFTLTLPEGTETPKRRKGDMPKTIAELEAERDALEAKRKMLALLVGICAVGGAIGLIIERLR